MTQVKISDFDVSEYLEDEESIAEYLNAVLEDGDSSLLLASIGLSEHKFHIFVSV